MHLSPPFLAQKGKLKERKLGRFTGCLRVSHSTEVIIES